MVVGLTFDDGAGAIDLLGEGEAYHLVGEGHLRETELFVGTAVNGGGEAVGASDDEDEAAGSLLLLFEPTGKLDAAVFLAMLVEQDDGVRGLQLFKDQFSLALFLLFLREVLGIFQFRNGDNLEGHIMSNTFYIVVYAGYEVLIDGLAYLYENSLH